MRSINTYLSKFNHQYTNLTGKLSHAIRLHNSFGGLGGGEFVHRMILRRGHKLPKPILHHKPKQIGRAILKHTYYSYNTYICYVCLIYDLPMFLDLWIWSITLKLNINPRPSYVCLTLEANLTITKVADKECNPFGEYIMYWLW